ncbi:MAG: hypothetical protein EOP48_11420 [Sphingobacteriales bacterium]|nr:MAG: hypothetical protein EOP48_11420 [Sphingobacteriales bacterium]
MVFGGVGLDNLQGHYPAGYFDDALHPNNSGYVEFFSTISPSLFTALGINKPRPSKMSTTSVELTSAKESLDFNPDGSVHAMTVLVDVQTSGKGDLLQIVTPNGIANIRINNAGRAEYVAANNAVITSANTINNNAWHTLALTHYFAQGVTHFYVDGQRQNGQVAERRTTQKLTLKGLNTSINLRNFMFYRSAMNSRELAALQSGQLLQSSLALYAPLNGQGKNIKDALQNYAQSMETLSYSSINSAVIVYQDCNFNGYSIALTEGSYDLNQLNAIGIKNDDISSLRVQAGYQIKMYQNWDFSGITLTKNMDDSCLVDDGYNDDISSVVISRISG